MYRKIVWCYLIVLTLLDISLNTKLSAQGKSHGNGVSVHESLMEGISLQEWGAESGAAAAGGAGGAAGVLALAPRALAFGRRALAAAHVLRVTITNTHNDTLHLASVAGTTPDFHASFFDSKTLASGANTSFSVVYLGRREGLVATHLYIHTSKGVHKYPVSAVGVASAWRVWPLVGLRVPLNASVEPLLTIYNPTHTTIQISEVYSSGAWLGLALPAGGGEAARALWTLPPHAARPLVRLLVRPPASDYSAAYIRIKGNMTGGGLVVGVEAARAPPGEHLHPLHVRLGTRGSRDKPDTLYVEAGTSDSAGARLEAHVTGGCPAPAAPSAPSAPSAPPGGDARATHNGGGVGVGAGGVGDASGITVELLRDQLAPLQPLTRAAHLTLHYAKMWKNYEKMMSGETNGGAANGGAVNGGALTRGETFCSGVVHVGRASMPYSLRLLPGTLVLDPQEMHFVTCNAEEAMKPQTLTARNEFPEPVHITHVDIPPEVHLYFHMEVLTPLVVEAGASGAALRVRLRTPAPTPPAPAGTAPPSLRTWLTLRTNLSDYTLPLLLYEGTLKIEWEWPNSEDGTLRLGALGTSRRHAVRARLRNAGPVALCGVRLAAHLPRGEAHFHLQAGAAAGAGGGAACVPAGAAHDATLTLLTPAAEGALAGAAHAHTAHGRVSAHVTLHARRGSLHAHALLLPPAAPYVWASAPLELESSMSVRMRVLRVTPAPAPAALSFLASGEQEVGPGRRVVGRVQFAPEALCQPHCCTGLQLDTPEGAAWLARGARQDAAALHADAALQRARHTMLAPTLHNYTLLLHTTEVVQTAVSVTARTAWPAVWRAGAGAGGAGGAGAGGEGGGGARASLCGVGATLPLHLRAHNPAQRPLLLQPRLAVHPLLLGGGEEHGACVGCVWSAPSFQVGEWRVTRGGAAAYREGGAGGGGGAPYLLLQPGAEVEFTVTFAPTQPADLAAYLYLRNNLTVLERVLVTGRGVLPSVELAGRRANSSAPILFEVTECGAGGAGGAGGGGGAGVARRALAVRNTGRVAVRLRGWRVGGAACVGAAFRLQPCAPLTLQPGEKHTLHLHYAADWTNTNTQTTLSVSVGGSWARWSLAGLTPARLLAGCAPPAPHAPRAPFEPHLRALALALALLALIGAAGLAGADAERALRRHRSAREAQGAQGAPGACAPLDLRSLARAPSPAPGPRAAPLPAPAAAPRRRRAPRPRLPPAPADAHAERLAFERWRAAPPPEDDSRSDEEGEGAAPPAPPPPPPPRGDASSSSPDSSPPPLRDSYALLPRRVEAEHSSSEESSSPGEERAPPPHAPPLFVAPAHAPTRGSRQRREGAEARRSERKAVESHAHELAASGALSAPPAPAPPPAPRPPHPRKERAAARRRTRSPPCAGAPAGATWCREGTSPTTTKAEEQAGRPARWRPSGRTCGGGSARTRCSTTGARPRGPPPRPRRRPPRPCPRPVSTCRASSTTRTRTRTSRGTERRTLQATARWSRCGAPRSSRWRRAPRGCGARVWAGERRAPARPLPPARTPCAPRPGSPRPAPCAPTTPSSRWPPSGPRRRSTGAWTRPLRPPRRPPPPPRPSPTSSWTPPPTRPAERWKNLIARLVWMPFRSCIAAVSKYFYSLSVIVMFESEND